MSNGHAVQADVHAVFSTPHRSGCEAINVLATASVDSEIRALVRRGCINTLTEWSDLSAFSPCNRDGRGWHAAGWHTVFSKREPHRKNPASRGEDTGAIEIDRWFNR